MEDLLPRTLRPSSPRIVLPHLVWRGIIYQLADDLPTLLLLSAMNSEMQDICRPHTSSFFRTIGSAVPPIPKEHYHHSLLLLVLEGHLDPSSIFEFYFPDPWRSAPKLDPSPIQRWSSHEELFRKAVCASELIPVDLVPEVCTRFVHGDPDAALVVLLPLCTRLKLLEFPGRLKMCAAMFQTVAREHRARGTDPVQARDKANEAALRDRHGRPWRETSTRHTSQALPFSELLVLHSGSDVNDHAFEVIAILPYMGIPSLRRITLTSPRDQDFAGWAAGDTGCSCPEIYFQQAMVTRPAVLAFAQGLTAPCEIRQWYERDCHFYPGGPDDPTWDRVLITQRPDGRKEIETRLEWAGGNPGYDYPWVSWLYNGKMRDWMRLDEEFKPQEDDYENDWLNGILG